MDPRAILHALADCAESTRQRAPPLLRVRQHQDAPPQAPLLLDFGIGQARNPRPAGRYSGRFGARHAEAFTDTFPNLFPSSLLAKSLSGDCQKHSSPALRIEKSDE
jgi:hypothetical protein